MLVSFPRGALLSVLMLRGSSFSTQTEAVNRPPCLQARTQTDEFVPLPIDVPFLPPKRGIDAATQRKSLVHIYLRILGVCVDQGLDASEVVH